MAAAGRYSGHAVMKCCFVLFFFSFFNAVVKFVAKKSSMPAHVSYKQAGLSFVTIVVCVFYPECYNKDILP